jgi:hypothetical protein
LTAWFVDRMLPGLATSVLVSIVVWLSHARTRRHITRVTNRQTATLTAGCSCNYGTEEEATMAEVPAPAPPHRSLYSHVPHPHLKHRAEQGPATIAAGQAGKSTVARFNTRAAVLVSRAVGTMYCAYAFCVLAFYGLPAGLHAGAAGFVQWASSQFIQLVLLPIILVGSAVLAEASDRMAKRQFDDVEAILHEQSEQAAHLAAQDEKILAILAAVSAPPQAEEGS